MANTLDTSHNSFNLIYNGTWKLIVYESDNNIVHITDIGSGKILRKELLISILIYNLADTIENIITLLKNQEISTHTKIQVGLLHDLTQGCIHFYQPILSFFHIGSCDHQQD